MTGWLGLLLALWAAPQSLPQWDTVSAANSRLIAMAVVLAVIALLS